MLSFWHAKRKLKDLVLAMQLDAELNSDMVEKDEIFEDTLMDSLPAKDGDVTPTGVLKGADGTLTGPISPEKPPETG